MIFLVSNVRFVPCERPTIFFKESIRYALWWHLTPCFLFLLEILGCQNIPKNLEVGRINVQCFFRCLMTIRVSGNQVFLHHIINQITLGYDNLLNIRPIERPRRMHLLTCGFLDNTVSGSCRSQWSLRQSTTDRLYQIFGFYVNCRRSLMRLWWAPRMMQVLLCCLSCQGRTLHILLWLLSLQRLLIDNKDSIPWSFLTVKDGASSLDRVGTLASRRLLLTIPCLMLKLSIRWNDSEVLKSLSQRLVIVLDLIVLLLQAWYFSCI